MSAHIALQRGLPDNLDCERFVLGSIQLQGSEVFERIGPGITAACFALEKHRKIWQRMTDLHSRREEIDRVTVANELNRHGELESVDGLSYLASLDDGLPLISNLDRYAAILVEKFALRQLAVARTLFTPQPWARRSPRP